ncbi:MAG: thioredoxin family protein [Verrucomicrobiota bacterium]
MKRFLLFLAFVQLLFLGSESLQAQSARTKVTMLSSVERFEAGKPFKVGIRLQMPVGWHTYWVNPGDSGIPTEVIWKLPDGFSASALEWPIPERIEALPLVTLGYENEVVLFSVITPSASVKKGSKVAIVAEVRWLECKETCIPGKATVSMDLVSAEKEIPQSNAELMTVWNRFQKEIPRETIAASSEVFPDKSFRIKVQKAGIQSVQFFPRTEGKIALAQPFSYKIDSGGVEISGRFEEFSDKLAGVLVVKGVSGEELLQFDSEVKTMSQGSTVVSEKRSLGVILFFAFIGGLILNLMPCVLPVLSLKILGFVNDAEGDASKAWKQGAAFTMGVLISFWILTGILVALRLGGEGLGWGFQLQSPAFVLGMIFFFLAMTLNLFGVFEFGASLTSLQNQVTDKKGWAKSFGSGVLAVVVATPCSAPFMGAAVGYALSQSIGLTFLVMTFLGFGVAAPYLFLSLKPEWIRKMPKPGEWMIGFKQFLGFLMLGTVLWLIWVYAQLQGIAGLGSVLMASLLLSFGIWGWSRAQKVLMKVLSVMFIIAAIGVSLPESKKIPVESFSSARLEALHQEGKPVFVDFTAAWCLTCQVNKKLVLHTAEIQKAFREKGVTVMEADWTNSDPEITKALETFGRASVPLYVLYGKDSKAAPQVLPEILTKEIVLKALKGI